MKKTISLILTLSLITLSLCSCFGRKSNKDKNGDGEISVFYYTFSDTYISSVRSEFKKILAKHKVRYTSDTDVTPDPEREYRMIPATRWASALGVRPLDKVAIRAPRMPAPGEVSIPLRGHIGAPSVPCVKEGDTVTVGQCIATAADGLSVPQHATIDGKVTLVTDEKITIERV